MLFRSVSQSRYGTIQWLTNNGQAIPTANGYIKPLITTTYTAYCIGADNCSKSNVESITINVKDKIPTPSITSPTQDIIICADAPVKLKANGCIGNLRWSNQMTGPEITITREQAGTFQVICELNKCSSDSSNRRKITAPSIPQKPIIIPSKKLACKGEKITLTAYGCSDIVRWYKDEVRDKREGSVITDTLGQKTTFTATCYNGCSESSKSDPVTIDVKNELNPTIKIMADGKDITTTTVCANQKVTLSSQNSCDDISWFNNSTRIGKGSSIIINPTPTEAQYTAICTQNECVSERSNVITLNYHPSVTAPVISETIIEECYGTLINDGYLNTKGICANTTLKWSYDTTQPTVTSSKEYHAFCLDSTSTSKCPSDNVSLTIRPKSSSSVKDTSTIETPAKTTFCYDELVTLKATGCTSNNEYSWTNGQKGGTISFNAKESTTITVSCQKNDDNCLVQGKPSNAVKIEVKPKIDTPKINKLSEPQMKLLERTYQANDATVLTCVIPTKDNGLLLGGYSKGPSELDKSEASNGDYDYWVIKIDSKGTRLWDKTFGTKGAEYLTSMIELDGGYLLGGYSLDSLKNFDYYVVKIKSFDGMPEWKKTYEGTQNDYLQTMLLCKDAKHILLGGISSTEKKSDYRVIKIDGNGKSVWDYTFGGSGDDALFALAEVGNNFVLAGSSNSPKDDVKTEDSKGMLDFWVMTIDSNGKKLKDLTTGSNANEMLNSMVQFDASHLILAGNDVTNNKIIVKKIAIATDGTISDQSNDFSKFKGDSLGTLTSMVKIRDGILLGGRLNDNKKSFLMNIDALSGETIWRIDDTLRNSYISMALTADTNYVMIGSNKLDTLTAYRVKQVPLFKDKITDILTVENCSGVVEWKENGNKYNGPVSNTGGRSSISVKLGTNKSFTATCKIADCSSQESDELKVQSVSPPVKPTAITAAMDTTKGQTAVSTRIDVNLSLLQESTYLVFPNPANEVLRVMTTLQGPTHFVLFDVLGNKVLEETFESQLQIPIKHLDKGNYFYQISNQEKASTGRVQILH